MAHMKFDIAKMERLNDEARFETIEPDRIWAALANPEPPVIVDIGAGTGLFAARFAAMAPAATVYAVDVEPPMLDWMRDNRPEVASGRIVPVLAEESTIPLDGGIADVVVMINLHHELADPVASYRETSRLLREGGRVAVVDWVDAETPKGPPLHIRASAETIAEMLGRAGFIGVEVHPAMRWHTLVTGSASE